IAINPIIFAGGIAVIARDGVPSDALLSVIAVARLGYLSPDTDVRVGAVTNLSMLGDGYGCALLNSTRGLAVAATVPTTRSPEQPRSTPPVRDSIIIRLATEPATANMLATVHCRIDYGVGAAAADGQFPLLPLAGGPGVWTTDDPLVLEAIEISQFTPGQACP